MRFLRRSTAAAVPPRQTGSSGHGGRPDPNAPPDRRSHLLPLWFLFLLNSCSLCESWFGFEHLYQPFQRQNCGFCGSRRQSFGPVSNTALRLAPIKRRWLGPLACSVLRPLAQCFGHLLGTSGDRPQPWLSVQQWSSAQPWSSAQLWCHSGHRCGRCRQIRAVERVSTRACRP